MKSVAGKSCRALLILALATSSSSQSSIACRPSGRLVPLAGLWEASGVALSGGSPSRLWVINDSDQPVVYSVDLTGRIVGRALIAGATVEDWEDLASGRCPLGRCLFIADIGDNTARRSRVSIYRVAEPQPGSITTVMAEVFHATYPDGPHDAESIFVDENGRMFVITKGRTAGIYRFPAAPAPNSTSTLERVAQVTLSPRTDASRSKTSGSDTEPATGAALSADGNWIAIRSNRSVWFFRASDLAAGRPVDPIRVDVTSAREPQGEGLAFGVDNTVYLVGEGGSKGRPGTLTTFSCVMQPR